MLVLRDDVCTTAWCEAPIVHADHTTPARDGGRTGFEDGNGKCARCNQTKEAPGWRTRVVLTEGGHSDRNGIRDRDSEGGRPSFRDGVRDRDEDRRGVRDAKGLREGNDDRPDSRDEVRGGDDDRSSGQLARQAERAAGVQRLVQVTTPLGHQYESEPPPLLGWGSQSPPWATAGPGPKHREGAREPNPVSAAARTAPDSSPRVSTTPGPNLDLRTATQTAASTRAREPARARSPTTATTTRHQPPRTPALPLPHLMVIRAVTHATGRADHGPGDPRATAS